LTAALTAVRRIMQEQDLYPAVFVDTAQRIIETNVGFDRLIGQVARRDFFAMTSPDHPNLLRDFCMKRGCLSQHFQP